MSADYIREAIRNGLQEIGISDHGPIPAVLHDPQGVRRQLARTPDGRAHLRTGLPARSRREASAPTGTRSPSAPALEIEYIPGHDDYYRWLLTKVEYLVLGIHYFPSVGGLYNAYDTDDRPAHRRIRGARRAGACDRVLHDSSPTPTSFS
ncbi:MAG: hypothetical protein MZU95_08300 [Desulfomicrobium escambiense]|nr:hypothetical protein [Desulfomicrobium escambiense]